MYAPAHRFHFFVTLPAPRPGDRAHGDGVFLPLGGRCQAGGLPPDLTSVFVLLEHRRGKDVHWDFMIELPGRGELATWRLAADPAVERGPIAADAIFAHPRRFLDYEGPLRGDKGQVRRIDRGEAEILPCADDRLRCRLAGRVLRGVFELCAGAAGAWTWRVADADGTST